MEPTQPTRASEPPSETQLLRDIAYLERQVERLARPSSTWERGALNCYRVLARQRRRLLAAITEEGDARA